MSLAVAAPTATATGDQQRSYVFAPTGQTIPFRIYVPTSWDGHGALPVLLFLHGAGANERTYLDSSNGLLRKLAEQHGYIVVSPLGFSPLGAYGNPLRRPAVFGRSDLAVAQTAAVTADRRRELALSELDVMTVLELVTEEYGADRARTFLAGHSMGSGGVWHLAARFPERWRAIAPMSGPFVDKNGTAMNSGGGSEILAGHGSIHGPGGQSVFTDADADVLVYHYYADNGAARLGINLLGYDSAGWPYVY
jgi:poly(3-hydroxybutyrate) depolymerase